MVHNGKVDSTIFIEFCKRLLRDAATPVQCRFLMCRGVGGGA
jgi:hypothetical protein